MGIPSFPALEAESLAKGEEQPWPTLTNFRQHDSTQWPHAVGRANFVGFSWPRLAWTSIAGHMLAWTRCAGQAPPSGVKVAKYVRKKMVEPLLSGILLGLIPVTLSGLFVTAYLQYRRGDQLNL